MFDPTEAQTTEVQAPEATEVEAPEAQEVQTEEAATEPEGYYTPEEVREIGIEKLDPNRIPEELKPYYKSMQADYTRKTQSVAEQKKELLELAEAMKVSQPKQQAPEPQTIDAMYDRDPQGVTRQINERIAALVSDDPYGNAVEIEQLRDLKVNLVENKAQREYAQLNTNRTIESHQNELMKAIPDWDAKKESLLKFAVEELGWTQQMVFDKTDYLRHGADVNKFIMGVNKMYDKVHAPKTMETKKTQPKPTQVEAPGTGFKAPAGPTYDQLLQEAKDTGDFSKVLKAKGYL